RGVEVGDAAFIRIAHKLDEFFVAEPHLVRRVLDADRPGAHADQGRLDACAADGHLIGAAPEFARFLIGGAGLSRHRQGADRGRWLEGVIRRMNRHKEKPEFCLVAGDLAEHGRKEQLAAMRDLLKTLAMPAHVVIGNHDYVTQTDRKAFEEIYPDRLNYKFE